MRLRTKTFFAVRGSFRMCVFLLPAMLPCVFSSSARGDIYRFVAIDGVETFTDAPVEKDAKIVIKDPPPSARGRTKSSKAKNISGASLDEIVEKTIQAALNPQDSPSRSVEPRLPPVGGVITSGVGMRTDPVDGKWRHHNGIDIAIPEGTPVAPAAPGVVVYSGFRSGYGNTLIVEHDDGLLTLYGHNSRLLAAQGQRVGADTTIALSGNTGRSTGPHLHFEAWQSGVNVTSLFMPGSSQKLPKSELAAVRAKNHFRKEVLADGSLLFTNIPLSIP